jgi:hypothetical protein
MFFIQFASIQPVKDYIAWELPSGGEARAGGERIGLACPLTASLI